MESPEWFLFTFLRFVIPLAILKWPLAGIFASIAADILLSHFLPVRTPQDHETYQIWDKVLDTYYLAIAAYVSFSWKDKAARAVSLFAFGYRVIGVALFIATGIQPLLFLFPNFFENFFIFYLIYTKFAHSKEVFTSHFVFLVIFIAVLLPKLVQEYFLHIDYRRLKDFVALEEPQWLEQLLPFDLALLDILQVPLLFALPIVVLLWRIKATRRHPTPRSKKR